MNCFLQKNSILNYKLKYRYLNVNHIIKNTVILIFCLLNWCIVILAQKPVGVVFLKKTHDFNVISEDDNLQVCEFIFVNQGIKKVAVTNVQSTCGCAVPIYTREPIAPGKQGKVKVAYNPQGRPGRFKRSIFVYFDGSPERVELNILGMVVQGKERKNKHFPYVIGNLQLRTNTIRLMPMRANEQQQNILVLNSGEQPFFLECISVDPALSGKMQPAMLKPGMTGEIQITRKADASKAQTKVVKVVEQKAHPQHKDRIYIELVTLEENFP